MAVEFDFRGQCLPHVAEPKADAVSGQTHRSEIHMGTERHRLHRTETKRIVRSNINNDHLVFIFFFPHSLQSFSLWPAGCCCCSESAGFAGSSASSAHSHCGSASSQQRLPHLPCLYGPEGMESSGRPLLPVCHRKYYNNFTFLPSFTPKSFCVYSIYIIWDTTASPRLTCMLCCGCSTRYWLSPVGGLLEELLVWARGCGLSTKNGGWVPSLKCRGISKLFLSWRVCVMSKSRTTSYGAKKTTERDQSEILYLGSILHVWTSVYHITVD